MTIATHTLGCKLNFAETSHLQRTFTKAGFHTVGFHEKADVYVINSCTVTSVAEKKCRNAIRQAVVQNPNAIIAVIGCFAQNEAEQIAQIPNVDFILGNEQKHRLLELIATSGWSKPSKPHIDTTEPHSFQLSYSLGDRTRTFFKIQDGCDYFCSYCAIPFARGRSRSASIADTVSAARTIATSGVREIVLTGVNTGTFGQQHGESFLELLRQLDDIEEIARYRISSIEPNLLTEEIIDFVAHSRTFLPHFHIPLQSGSDRVLHAMHRHYDTALYAQRIEHIKQLMPDACIAADIIAGFNYEDDEAFATSMAFVDSLPISYLHVFPYSDRPHTAALRMGGRVPVAERRQRSDQLRQLSDHKRQQFIESQMGNCRAVLWEHTCHHTLQGATMQGWTDNYIRLYRPYDPSLLGLVTPYTISPNTVVNNFCCVD